MNKVTLQVQRGTFRQGFGYWCLLNGLNSLLLIYQNKHDGDCRFDAMLTSLLLYFMSIYKQTHLC